MRRRVEARDSIKSSSDSVYFDMGKLEFRLDWNILFVSFGYPLSISKSCRRSKRLEIWGWFACAVNGVEFAERKQRTCKPRGFTPAVQRLSASVSTYYLHWWHWQSSSMLWSPRASLTPWRKLFHQDPESSSTKNRAFQSRKSWQLQPIITLIEALSHWRAKLSLAKVTQKSSVIGSQRNKGYVGGAGVYALSIKTEAHSLQTPKIVLKRVKSRKVQVFRLVFVHDHELQGGRARSFDLSSFCLTFSAC